MRAALLLCLLVMCGCKKQTPQAALPQPQMHRTVWDEILAKPEYSNEIAQAELQLPTDEWTNVTFRPGSDGYRVNASRSKRINTVCQKMVAEVKPKLKEMSVTNLVYCFKLINYPARLGNEFGDVASALFSYGNILVQQEMESRPLDDLKVLRTFRNDKVTFYEGPQGFQMPIPWQLDEVITDVREGHTIVPKQSTTNQ